MNKILVFCSTLLLCVLFTACPEPGYRSFKYTFENNSQDTVGLSIYVHRKAAKYDEVIYFLKAEDIPPMSSFGGGAQHTGSDHSWYSFFEDERIDTLYFYVVKIMPEAIGIDQKCKLPKKDSNVLKILKYHAGNTDLKNMVSPTITYP